MPKERMRDSGMNFRFIEVLVPRLKQSNEFKNDRAYVDYVYESIEYDYDEIIDMVIEESETLTEESYNKEEEEWVDDEAQDTFHEEMWEVINDKVWEFCMEEVNYINDNPQDFEEESD